jgi:hypothetical protein
MSTRVVLVDDELNIWQAMGRPFHSIRNEWNMEFLSPAQQRQTAGSNVERQLMGSVTLKY